MMTNKLKKTIIDGVEVSPEHGFKGDKDAW